jgi:S1-C subfamily serine protease
MRNVVCAILVAACLATAPRAEPSKRILDAADHARTKVIILKTTRGNIFSSATGFLIRPGLVLTAGHAVSPTASVQAWVNGVAYHATVTAIHPDNDLALLRLDAPHLYLKPVELADDSRALSAGEDLLIVAGPSQEPGSHGDPAQRALISGQFRQRLQLHDPDGRLETMLALETSVERGDSGSPVVRVRDGSVVGILSSRQLPDETGVSHAAYAVPVEAIRSWIDAATRPAAEPGDFYLFGLPPRKG